MKKLIKQQFEENKNSWEKSFLEGFSQDAFGNALPWMTYPAIEFLEKNLNKNHSVFEFGSGASTLFFAKRVGRVMSLETNEKWFEIVGKKLAQNANSNVERSLMIDGLTNQNYENFAKNSGEKFDFIIVDSLKRFECAKNAVEALKPSATIILDDSERENYKKIFNFFSDKGFEKNDFFGIAPGQLRIKNTTIFKNPLL